MRLNFYIWFCYAQDKNPCRGHIKKSEEDKIYEIVLHVKPCLNSIYNQGQKVTQPFKRTGLQEKFCLTGQWEVHTFPAHKTLQRNEKFNYFGYGSCGINHF